MQKHHYRKRHPNYVGTRDPNNHLQQAKKLLKIVKEYKKSHFGGGGGLMPIPMQEIKQIYK